MAPKKKKQNESDGSSLKTVGATAADENSAMATFPSGLEDLLDRRLNQQFDKINELFLKFSNTTKIDLQSIKKSQDFLAEKFDDLVASTNKLKDEITELRKTNLKLQNRVDALESQSIPLENDIESMKRMKRRDMLEFHGIPESSDENTTSIVLQVVELIAPELHLCQSDISTSHRLPAVSGRIKQIIVKFVRRDIRNMVFSKKRNLRAKTAQDIGYSQDSRLFINESLTAISHAIFNKVKEFKRQHEFKFIIYTATKSKC